MTEHLPECWATYPSDPPAWCICDELRACEQRVLKDTATRHLALIKMIGLGILQTRADALRACEDRVREDERSNNFTPDDHSDAMTESYHRGFDDARWIAAKEALEGVLHEEPCDCEPCKAITRALAELWTIGNVSDEVR